MVAILNSLMFVASVCVIAHATTSGQPGNTCRAVQEYLHQNSITLVNQTDADQPSTSIGRNERVCLSKSDQCCPDSVESRILSQSTMDLKDYFRMVISPQRDFIHVFMQSFKQRTLAAINASADRTHDMFVRSYGVVYRRNHEPVSDFYRALYAFIDESTERERAIAPSRTVEQIFANLRDLLRRTLFVIFADFRKAGDRFVNCMLNLMQTMAQSQARVSAEQSSSSGAGSGSAAASDWFGEDADKLEKLGVRTLTAARTILTTLNRLYDMLDTLIKNVPISDACQRTFAALRHCAPCAQTFLSAPISGSRAALGVCPSSCQAFREACLNVSRDFLESWNTTFDMLIRVLHGYETSWNVQSLGEQMPVSMSTIVMNFQNTLLDKANQPPFSSCLNSAGGLSAVRQKREAATEQASTPSANVRTRKRKTLKPTASATTAYNTTRFVSADITLGSNVTSSVISTTSSINTTMSMSTTRASTKAILQSSSSNAAKELSTRAAKATKRKVTRDFVIGKNNMPTLAPSYSSRTGNVTSLTYTTMNTKANAPANKTTSIATSRTKPMKKKVPTTTTTTTTAAVSTSRTSASTNAATRVRWTKASTTTTTVMPTQKPKGKGGKKDRNNGANSGKANPDRPNSGRNRPAETASSTRQDQAIQQLTRTRQIWPRLMAVCNLTKAFTPGSVSPSDDNEDAENQEDSRANEASVGDVCWNGTYHVVYDPNASIVALARAFAADFRFTRTHDSAVRERFRQLRQQLNLITADLNAVDAAANAQRRDGQINSIQVVPSSGPGPQPSDLVSSQEKELDNPTPPPRKSPRPRKKQPTRRPAGVSSATVKTISDEQLSESSADGEANIEEDRRNAAQPSDDEVYDGSGTPSTRCANSDDEECETNRGRSDDTMTDGSADSADGSADDYNAFEAAINKQDREQFETTRLPQPTIVNPPRTNPRAANNKEDARLGLIRSGATTLLSGVKVSLLLGFVTLVHSISRFLVSA